MALTLGLTGMDQATEAALKAAFRDAGGRVGTWQLVGESDADYVIVDMDSMYGPMSWLRLHAAGKQVVGLTSAPRTQADYRLPRPFAAEDLVALLGEIGGTAPAPAATPAPEPPKPAPAPAPAPTPASEPVAEPVATSTRNTAFAHWLRPGALTGRARYQSGKGPELFIDFAQRQYYGPATLKPLADYFSAVVGLRDFEQLEDKAWQGAIAALGAAQSLTRLQWYGGLLAGEGQLLPGYSPASRFTLSKWPETEREYPRHFRIATAMMKGPSTIAEIAAASGVPEEDVIDFINANLTTGFAEQQGEGGDPGDGKSDAKSGGLLGRLRGR